MNPFATFDDVSVILRRDFTGDEIRAVDLMLDNASAEIRAYTRQTITAVANDAVILHGCWSHRLVLPERPVTAVGAVTVGVSPLVVDVDYTWPGRDVLLRGPKLAANQTSDSGRGGMWGGTDSPISLTYSHGYAPGADGLTVARAVCIDLVERRLTRPQGVVQEHLGAYRVQYDPMEPSGMVLSPGDKLRLNRYRRSGTQT